jgi:hypothetical protein
MKRLQTESHPGKNVTGRLPNVKLSYSHLISRQCNFPQLWWVITHTGHCFQERSMITFTNRLSLTPPKIKTPCFDLDMVAYTCNPFPWEEEKAKEL